MGSPMLLQRVLTAWPDWPIFEDKFSCKSSPNIWWHFWLFLKNVTIQVKLPWLLFGQLLEESWTNELSNLVTLVLRFKISSFAEKNWQAICSFTVYFLLKYTIEFHFVQVWELATFSLFFGKSRFRPIQFYNIAIVITLHKSWHLAARLYNVQLLPTHSVQRCQIFFE